MGQLVCSKSVLISFLAVAVALWLGWSSSQTMKAIRAANAGASLPGRRAVVVGGTSGIGHGIAARLAQAKMGVTIVGRDETRGNAVVEELRTLGGEGHEFVRCDASLLGNVATCTAAITARHPVIDMLVLTQGIATTQGYTPTREGIDVKLALHYYSRMGFVESLLPSLRRAESPRVLTVLTAGVHPPYAEYRTDPMLESHYSVTNAANACCFYNDLMMDAYSRDPANARIKFIHAVREECAGFGTESGVPL
jgi:NAD(P)-dependent dehydrogenase (short-subunit alcohol dehydrogenase family)